MSDDYDIDGREPTENIFSPRSRCPELWDESQVRASLSVVAELAELRRKRRSRNKECAKEWEE
jgi:hypothetical protein